MNRLKALAVAPWAALLMSAITGCSSLEKGLTTPEDETPIKKAPTHEAIIETYSDGESEYTGLYANFSFRATILNSTVRDSLVTRQAEYYQWDHEKTIAEREKAQKAMASETEVFVSFYTPERRNDNLSDAKTIWRVYLESGGHRYEGKAKKLRTLFAELQAMYPYFIRWNTAYSVTFPIPTTAIETQESTLTITGPLGTRTVKFPAMR